MKKITKILVAVGVAWLFFLSSPIEAKIEGDCRECHTDNNSPQEARDGDLWHEDCISCHAMGGDQRIVTLPGGIQVPQVYHRDLRGDLAGGNFIHITDNIGVGPMGSRKGHDVLDLFPHIFSFPPGFIHRDDPDIFDKGITCAGVNGCHGIRNQLMIGPQGLAVPRVGVAALRGSHHANVDGYLPVADTVVNSFRFLMGVRGLEHTYAPDRWQNVTPDIHNEYFGSTFKENYRLCSTCHVNSTSKTLDSYIRSPNYSMTGFCSTCHSEFHTNVGTSSAFLRHPSDFVIPNRGEYAKYRTYEVTAPVARPTVYTEPSDLVTPGLDLVMCLSCHVAHASPYDGMLRFDYSTMTAGDAGSAAGTGCFACHTNKGGY